MILRFFIALSFALITSVQAWGCSCLPIDSKSVSEHIGDKAVFVGTPLSSSSTNWYDDAVTTFKVHKGLQGEFGETVDIRHTQSGASCGVRYKTGKTQMILAYKMEEGLVTSLCSNPLPEIIVINYFEKQQDLDLLSHGECRHKGLLVPDPESKYYKTGDYKTTQQGSVCEIHTGKSYYGQAQAWKDWLAAQYFD